MILASAASGEGIDFGSVLFHILVVLVAAKLAAELAERIKVPAVLGEIAAGIIIGPSVIGVVEPDQVLTVLGEIGVIMLLLNVGLEMDIAEIARVGRASLSVAVIGVAAPFVGGVAAALALGQETKTAVFVGAALTATSVGITARVFGDLKALSSIESRIVLGAAVADDVLGLIILTVVTRIVVDGSVSAGTILSTTGLALGFLVVTGVLGTRLAPPFFSAVTRWSGSPATLVAVAFAFTMGFSSLADAAKLAPIIGAFMAGLALGKTKQAHRIERELAPIGHVFIPVFFLSIGISTDIGAVVKPSVLGIAAALTGVAIVGKLVAAAGAAGTRSDKLLIGLGMIPRGEVGLIFAAIGLSTGVLGDDLYAALIVMVLVTTVITPPLLRWQLGRKQKPTPVDEHADATEPDGGWLVLNDAPGVLGIGAQRVVDLNGQPPARLLLPLALDAARLAAEHRPSERLLSWFAEHRQRPITWDEATTASFISLLRLGNPRVWRFLETLGVLERALPEVSAALRARRADPTELDPLRVLRFPTLDRVTELSDKSNDPLAAGSLARLQGSTSGVGDAPLLLAALLLDLGDLVGDTAETAPSVLGQLSVSPAIERETAALVRDSGLLAASLYDPHALDQTLIDQIAEHIGSVDRLDALYVLSVARSATEPMTRAALNERRNRIEAVFADAGSPGLCDTKRAAAIALAVETAVAERIAHAPRSYVLAQEPEELVRQARLAEPAPQPGRARVAVSGHELSGHWRVDIACLDRPGLLATITQSLADLSLDIAAASVAVWGDRVVLDSFLVRAGQRPAAREIAERVEAGMSGTIRRLPVPPVTVRFDNDALPWHTLCTVEGEDSPGLLAAVTAAFAAAGVDVSDARITTEAHRAVDRFSLTTRNGAKLSSEDMQRISRVFEGESVSVGRRRIR